MNVIHGNRRECGGSVPWRVRGHPRSYNVAKPTIGNKKPRNGFFQLLQLGNLRNPEISGDFEKISEFPARSAGDFSQGYTFQDFLGPKVEKEWFFLGLAASFFQLFLERRFFITSVFFRFPVLKNQFFLTPMNTLRLSIALVLLLRHLLSVEHCPHSFAE